LSTPHINKLPSWKSVCAAAAADCDDSAGQQVRDERELMAAAERRRVHMTNDWRAGKCRVAFTERYFAAVYL